MVVNTTPPASTASLARRSARLAACTGGWRSRSWQRAKVAEELIVELVTVGQHDHGRVCHRGLADDAPGVERHGQALPRALGVPHHADPSVAGIAARLPAGFVTAARLCDPSRFVLERRRAQGLADRGLYRVELVPDQRAAVVLEHDEVAQQRQEAPLLEDALDQHLQLRVEGRRQLLTVEVRHGLNHSRPAESVPIRACMPSDTASTALPANNEGNSAL